MKLLAATICLAAFAGCATDEAPNGGYLDGLRPAKPSLDDIRTIEPNDRLVEALNGNVAIRGDLTDAVLDDNTIAETIDSPLPIKTGCLACNREIVVLRDPTHVGELQVIDDFGHLFCKIWLDNDGHLRSTDCR